MVDAVAPCSIPGRLVAQRPALSATSRPGEILGLGDEEYAALQTAGVISTEPLWTRA